MAKRNITVILIILAMGTFYLTTIRDGHIWDGDFAMYIHHAKNIAEGNDYNNTGYIYNPFYPSLGPKTYPPIFPLMLSPIYNWFGLNLTAMKVLVILFFLASLSMIFLAFTRELPFQYLLAIIIVIAFNPYFWDFKDNILSDIPFLFFTYLSLYLINKVYNSDQFPAIPTTYAIILGTSIYLSYGTRSIGIVLIACLLIYDRITTKRTSQFAIMTVFFVIPLILLQNIFVHSDSSYFDTFRADWYVVMRNSYGYTKSLTVLWRNGYSAFIANVLFVGMSVLMVIGYLVRIKDRRTIFEIFPLVYVMAVIVWPTRQAPRFLIPVIPLCIFFSFVGVRYVSHLVKREAEQIIVMLSITVILISYVGQFTKMEYGAISEGVGKGESIALFKYVKEKTEKNDVFVFRKPRILSLFAGRASSVFHRVKDERNLWNYLQEIDAKYVIVGSTATLGDGFVIGNFVRKYNDRFEMVYSNVDFDVYRVKSDRRDVRNVGGKL